MSSTNFKKLTIESFGGISPDTPLVITFPENQNGSLTLIGDEATGKSSALQCIEALLGNVFNENYVNAKSKAIKGVVEFEKDGNQYRTVLTKTMFRFEQYINLAGKDSWTQIKEGKTLIRQLMPYASDPDALTKKDSEEQIIWLKKLAGSNADEANLLTQYKSEYSKRTDKNKEVAVYKRQLLESKHFTEEDKVVNPLPEFVEIQKTVSETDVDKIVELRLNEYNEAKKKELDYNKAVIALSNFDNEIVAKNNYISEKEEEIKRLQAQIEEKKVEIERINERKAEGQKYVEENKSILDTVKEAETELEEARKIKAQKEEILYTDKIYKDYNKATEEVHILNSTIDDIQQQRLELAKSFTPDIPGFEVRVGDGLDEQKGLFYNGINIATLSESERFGLCLKIWEHFKISVVMIENITSLGSHAMEIINMFIQNGGVVFATKMKRGQEKISVSFSLNE